jgi:hypothetical protein
MRGRPTNYSQETADEICSRIIESDYGLEQICEDDDLPSARTVFRWLAANDDFRQQYARAKEVQGHVQADRGIRDALTATDASLGRLKFDARKWAASKLAPKQYGDKIAVGGSDDLPPIQNVTRIELVAAKFDDDDPA